MTCADCRGSVSRIFTMSHVLSRVRTGRGDEAEVAHGLQKLCALLYFRTLGQGAVLHKKRLKQIRT